jgi:hypothetical protein
MSSYLLFGTAIGCILCSCWVPEWKSRFKGGDLRCRIEPRSHRTTVTLGLAIAITAPLFSQTTGQAAAHSKRTPEATIPRVAGGHPDLTGIWVNSTITPLERPDELAGKATMTDAEAREYEKKDIEVNTLDSDVESSFNKRTGGPGVGAYNNSWTDRGTELARVDGVKRTSLIIDPPNGKIPELTPEARERNSAFAAQANFDSVYNRPLGERCLSTAHSGPPILSGLYNNNYEIVQTSDVVAILAEQVHDVRMIRMNGTHAPSNVRKWLGDSIGHWEGDTLVVDTTNFTDKTRFRGASPNLHVIERFKRVDANTILYRATIDDPSTFTKQWTLEYPFVATKGPVYEYACQEGNYALTGILRGARKADEEAAK